jgi:hypothetical protein
MQAKSPDTAAPRILSTPAHVGNPPNVPPPDVPPPDRFPAERAEDASRVPQNVTFCNIA